MYHLIMVKATVCLGDVIPNSKQILSRYLNCDDMSDLRKVDSGRSRLAAGDGNGPAYLRILIVRQS